MAEQTSSIFNRHATEKLRNPDDLDKYVRVTNPSAWAVAVACVLLVAGLLIWGVFGTISTNVSAMGAYVNGKSICMLPDEEISRVKKGDRAIVEGYEQTVADVTKVPVSRDEARQMLGSDYLVSTLVSGDWAYVVTFEGDDTSLLTPDVPLTVQITTERVAPISLLFG